MINVTNKLNNQYTQNKNIHFKGNPSKVCRSVLLNRK